MALAEVMWVGVECDAKLFSSTAVVGAGVGQKGMALTREGFGEELCKIAKPNYGDLERLGLEVLG